MNNVTIVIFTGASYVLSVLLSVLIHKWYREASDVASTSSTEDALFCMTPLLNIVYCIVMLIYIAFCTVRDLLE